MVIHVFDKKKVCWRNQRYMGTLSWYSWALFEVGITFLPLSICSASYHNLFILMCNDFVQLMNLILHLRYMRKKPFFTFMNLFPDWSHKLKATFGGSCKVKSSSHRLLDHETKLKLVACRGNLSWEFPHIGHVVCFVESVLRYQLSPKELQPIFVPVDVLIARNKVEQ